ncbi:TIGR03905 family TSCPD domain-containing protein [Desulfovibrio sp. OttesenSCG-928-C06]|nr:TIGR03905 family TSCPD domain-containing protein [Desulfovibrio sp. OttesenSCG-928-C06]
MPIYKTSGVCSRSITFNVSPDGLVSGVSFDGGCHGNLQGIAKMVEGCKAWEVIDRLEGIHCDKKATSCPDQLARCLREYLEEHDIPAEKHLLENTPRPS